MKKKHKPSLILTLSSAGVLIGGGVAAFIILTQQNPVPRDLPVGANIIPQDAVFAVSLATDAAQWQRLRSFGTLQTQAELDQNLLAWRDRLLTNNGFDYDQDIKPWVGEEVTLAYVSPETSTRIVNAPDTAASKSGVVMVLPIKNQQLAQQILTKSKPLPGSKYIDRKYKGIDIKELQRRGEEKYSVAVIEQRYLVVTDSPKATNQAIDSYKSRDSLATLPGYTENFRKITVNKPFAHVYVNIPAAIKLTTANSKQQLPAPVLAQLQENQGLGATVTLESEGLRFRTVSWLKPSSQRLLTVENKAGDMSSRLPPNTLMMLSGGNLQRLWQDYVSTSQGNPLTPLPPEQLRAGIKSLTNLDLDKDLLSWMSDEFAVSVLPYAGKEGSQQDFRAGLVLMVKASDRAQADKSLQQLDEVMRSRQFEIKQATVGGQTVTNWISPFGTLTATRGWLDGNVAFISLGAPISESIVPKPPSSLATTQLFQQTVPTELQPHNGLLFLDIDNTSKNFPLPSLFPNQQMWLEAMRSIGVTNAISDQRSSRYDVFVTMKKAGTPKPLPKAESSPSSALPPPAQPKATIES